MPADPNGPRSKRAAARRRIEEKRAAARQRIAAKRAAEAAARAAAARRRRTVIGGVVAALVLVIVLVVFIAAVGSAWARGLQIDCGCFGNGGQVAAGETSYPAEILRDVALLLVALALARWPRSRLALGGRADPFEGELTRAR